MVTVALASAKEEGTGAFSKSHVHIYFELPHFAPGSRIDSDHTVAPCDLAANLVTPFVSPSIVRIGVLTRKTSTAVHGQGDGAGIWSQGGDRVC